MRLKERCADAYISISLEGEIRTGRTIFFTLTGAVIGAISLTGLIQLGGVEVALFQGIIGAILGGALGYRLTC